MPYIYKPAKKKNAYQSIASDKTMLRRKLYNKAAWRKLREGYLLEHPLCEICLAEGRTTAASDVHHIQSPFDDGLSDMERLYRLLDPCNLKALCQHCHGKLHGRNSG